MTRLPTTHALANRDLRVDDAVVADPRAGPDRDVGIDDGPRADRRAGADRHERADRDVRTERRVRRHRAGPDRRPFGGAGASVSSPTACANARYGCAVMQQRRAGRPATSRSPPAR